MFLQYEVTPGRCTQPLTFKPIIFLVQECKSKCPTEMALQPLLEYHPIWSLFAFCEVALIVSKFFLISSQIWSDMVFLQLPVSWTLEWERIPSSIVTSLQISAIILNPSHIFCFTIFPVFPCKTSMVSWIILTVLLFTFWISEYGVCQWTQDQVGVCPIQNVVELLFSVIWKLYFYWHIL